MRKGKPLEVLTEYSPDTDLSIWSCLNAAKALRFEAEHNDLNLFKDPIL